ncbi:MAG: purine-binding chemotaxis protein CheW [Woeseia sp.]|nr:chemotaxis protein CheW [Woeseia sp.]NNE61690.1 purine-binding chemotaxis protein CheW [Woeseia sp.]NNL53833.1 purine-binding chemotaxis protein CheW [Woeseia sp.]
MNTVSELQALVDTPFELLQELERRSRTALAGKSSGELSEEWVGVGFRIGEEQFVASREEVREILMLPDSITRVPGARRWLLGVANLRGHLLPLIDLKLFLGSGRTPLRRDSRVISVNHRDIPAGLVVDEVLGFRRFTQNEFANEWPETVVRCDRFIRGAYKRGHDNWPIFGLYELLASSSFLQAAAD